MNNHYSGPKRSKSPKINHCSGLSDPKKRIWAQDVEAQIELNKYRAAADGEDKLRWAIKTLLEDFDIGGVYYDARDLLDSCIIEEEEWPEGVGKFEHPKYLQYLECIQVLRKEIEDDD